MLFDPAVGRQVQGLRRAGVDSPTDVFPAALKYLGLDPNSKKPEDLDKAAEAINAIRPYVNSTGDLHKALAEGRPAWCSATPGTSSRCASGPRQRDIRYVIPKEGALAYMTVAAIPKEAPNPEAGLRFLDYLMDPEMAAASSKVTRYANAIPAATP